MQWKQNSKDNLLFEKHLNIGNCLLTVCVEQLDSKCKYIDLTEFMFKINNNTHKSKLNLFYTDMYKLFREVQKSLEDYIHEYIIKNLKDGFIHKIEFEADGSTEKEKRYKNNCYEFYLKRLSKQLNADGVICSYNKTNNLHYLSFTKVTT